MAKRHFATAALLEQAAPTTPAAGTLDVYAGTDHQLHTKDSNGKDQPVAKSYASRTAAVAAFR